MFVSRSMAGHSDLRCVECASCEWRYVYGVVRNPWPWQTDQELAASNGVRTHAARRHGTSARVIKGALP